MGHPEIKNRTPFAFEPLIVADEEGRPLLVPIVKATYQISSSGRLAVAEKQVPVNPAGEHYGDPLKTSYKYEPETAFFKPTTDVALIGHAHPRTAADAYVDVRLRVGPVEKTVRVVGDRVWVKRLGMVSISQPEPLQPTPLIYERAFGGWDCPEPDPERDRFEPRNPVGVGFPQKEFSEGAPVPNLEDPRKPLKFYGDKPPPACFGFTAPHWQPRAKLAGTYDAKWQESRAPLLPTDFDCRFFNAAASGLITEEYLKGDEPVLVENATPEGSLNFALPGIAPPAIRVALRDRGEQQLHTVLDTVIINTDENLLLLLWRTRLVLRNGPHDLAAIEVSAQVNREQAAAL